MNGIAVVDIRTGTYRHSIQLETCPGLLMPVGEHHVVCFHEYPRLVSLANGEIVEAWPDLDTGKDTGSSICMSHGYPIKALDQANRRFAVVQGDTIQVVRILE